MTKALPVLLPLCFWLTYPDNQSYSSFQNLTNPSQQRQRVTANQRQSRVGHDYTILGEIMAYSTDSRAQSLSSCHCARKNSMYSTKSNRPFNYESQSEDELWILKICWTCFLWLQLYCVVTCKLSGFQLHSPPAAPTPSLLCSTLISWTESLRMQKEKQCVRRGEERLHSSLYPSWKHIIHWLVLFLHRQASLF